MQSLCDLPSPKKLRWNINGMESEIDHAKQVMDKYVVFGVNMLVFHCSHWKSDCAFHYI